MTNLPPKDDEKHEAKSGEGGTTRAADGRGGGIPPRDAGVGPDAEDIEIICWFIRDAAGALEALARHTRAVAEFVQQAGLTASVSARIELRRTTRLTCRLLELASADLD